MAYTLNSTAIRRPTSMEESNSTQVAQQRSLGGTVARDYFGSNKRIWTLHYISAPKSDYDTINAIYQSYLLNAAAKTFAISETNYTISSTNVHIDLVFRSFRTKGTDYVSDFDLVLSEA